MNDNAWLADMLYNPPSDMTEREVMRAVIQFFETDSFSEQDRFLYSLDVNRLSFKYTNAVLRSSFYNRENLNEWYFFLHRATYRLIEDNAYDNRRLVGLVLVELD